MCALEKCRSTKRGNRQLKQQQHEQHHQGNDIRKRDEFEFVYMCVCVCAQVYVCVCVYQKSTKKIKQLAGWMSAIHHGLQFDSLDESRIDNNNLLHLTHILFKHSPSPSLWHNLCLSVSLAA